MRRARAPVLKDRTPAFLDMLDPPTSEKHVGQARASNYTESVQHNGHERLRTSHAPTCQMGCQPFFFDAPP